LGFSHLRSWLLASWAWARLDRETAAGLPTDGFEPRQLRAQTLALPEERRAIAAVLQNLLDAADTSAVSGSGRDRADALTILAQRDRLVELVGLLRGKASMTVRAVALAELLACDHASPLVSPHKNRGLSAALDEIAAANGP
jgi:hypothetical protein